MNQHPIYPQNASSSATVSIREKHIHPSRIILALGDCPQRALIENTIRSQGFSVLCVSESSEARRFARKKRISATFLAAESTHDESGWLTCRKLLFENPEHRVVIVGTEPTSQGERLAAFIGAAGYIPIEASEATIAKTVSAIHLPTPK